MRDKQNTCLYSFLSKPIVNTLVADIPIFKTHEKCLFEIPGVFKSADRKLF